MNADRKTVQVSSDSVGGYPEPKFVLEFEGKVYVTLAVLEYDPDDQEMDDDARSDLDELQGMLEGERPVTGTIHGHRPMEAAIAQSETRDDN